MKLIVLKNNVPLNEVSVETTDTSEMYEIYVGRSEDCHVQIDDPLISRHHFVLKNDNSVWYCEKLSQLGVITLNGALVSKNPVNNGDEIKCGIYSIIVTDLLVSKQSAPVRVEEPAYAEADDDLYADVVETPVQAKPQSKKAAPAPEPEPEPESLEDEVMDLSDGELPSEPLEATGEITNLDSLDDDSSNSMDSFNDNSSDSNNSTESLDTNFGGELTESSGFDSGDNPDGNYEVATTDGQDEKTSFFKAFVNYQLVLFGEHAPYDRFLIESDEVFIGRDQKKCQIILNDPEVSSVHAVIKKTLTDITLEDLNSSNGTILNGERINKAAITAGDEFVIGGTSFSLEVRSDLLDTESERLMPVESGQVVETEEVVEEEINGDGDLDFQADGPPEKSLFKRFKKDPAFRKKAIYAIVILAVGMLFLLDAEENDKPKKTENRQRRQED